MKNTDGWKDVFYFTKPERNGIIVLIFFCIGLFLVPHFWGHFFQPPPVDHAYFQQEVSAFLSNEEKEDASSDTLPLFYFDPNTASKSELIKLGLSEKTASTILKFRQKGGKFYQPDDLSKIYNLPEKDYKRLFSYIRISSSTLEVSSPETRPEGKPVKARFSQMEWKPFDPNQVPKQQLVAMGVPGKIANTWANFRDKGGRFYKPEDVRKIYGLTDDLYRQMQPYIVMEDSSAVAFISKKAASNPPELQRALVAIDVNRASVEEWQKLSGIGPVLSNRIVKFREKLGGFISVEQVAETYNLPDSTFQKIKPQLRWSSPQNLIKINFATEEELAAHPYINWKQAGVIIKYRNNHGPFNSPEDFQKVRVLSAEQHKKLAPYLKFD